MGNIVFSKKEHTDWLSNTKWLALKTNIYTCNIKQYKKGWRDSSAIKIARLTNKQKINEKRGHNFENEQGRICGYGWREERGEASHIIIL